MTPEQHSEYIVLAIREGASMYEEDARKFLAEHDAHVHVAALREAAAAVVKATGNELDANAKLLRRMADAAEGGEPR